VLLAAAEGAGVTAGLLASWWSIEAVIYNLNILGFQMFSCET